MMDFFTTGQKKKKKMWQPDHWLKTHQGRHACPFQLGQEFVTGLIGVLVLTHR